MPTIETSLHVSYQQGTWGIKEACRELISNALDGETRYKDVGSTFRPDGTFGPVGGVHLDYSARTQTLTVKNDFVTVPAKALLMGTSESREDDRTIGQFGEGLPMALLALARLNYAVEIDNGDERWKPRIERSSTFQGEPVLVIDTRKLKIDRHAFEVRVEGISSADWREIRSLFLRLDTTLDIKQTVGRYGPTDLENGRVLLQPQYMGRVYNKGVYVMYREDLMFGYDLHGELNRDRSLMNEYELKGKLAELLVSAARNNAEAFLPLLADAVFGEGKLELDDGYSDLVYNQLLGDCVMQKWLEKHGELALPVNSDEEERKAKTIGRTPIRTTETLRRIITRRTGTASELATRLAREVTYTYESALLNGPERYHFEVVKTLIKVVRPGKELNFEVVDFTSAEVPWRAERKEEVFSVQISRAHLMDFKSALLHMARAATSILSGDGTSDTLIADVTAKLMSGDPIVSLLLLSKESIGTRGP